MPLQAWRQRRRPRLMRRSLHLGIERSLFERLLGGGRREVASEPFATWCRSEAPLATSSTPIALGVPSPTALERACETLEPDGARCPAAITFDPWLPTCLHPASGCARPGAGCPSSPAARRCSVSWSGG